MTDRDQALAAIEEAQRSMEKVVNMTVYEMKSAMAKTRMAFTWCTIVLGLLLLVVVLAVFQGKAQRNQIIETQRRVEHKQDEVLRWLYARTGNGGE